MPPREQRHERNFLPDFGSFGMAIRFILLAELIAIIITIGRNAVFDEQAWQDFNMLSAFAIAISLFSVVILKLAAPLLRRTSVAFGSVLVVVLLLFVTAIGTDGMIFALHDFGLIPERWPAWRESLIIRSLMVAFIISVFGLRYVIAQHRAEVEARAQQEARMQALQSRIRPHFLFNSLNSVASLTRSNPEKGEAVLHDLADLFRVLLADARKLVPISAEREISRQYLEIEKIRLGDRLTVQWNMSPNIPRAALIPALTMQPLLENAIYHGIEPRFAGGAIKIDMWAEGETLNILISNPLPDVRKNTPGKGNKIAQENTRQRLTTQFGAAASLQAFEEGGQYHVKVKMPIVRG
ncbi:MAG: histidine kinase [Gammaproteobacteria bacterium]|nr:histidine kinase [Gammaproteobacteria bacterium]